MYRSAFFFDPKNLEETNNNEQELRRLIAKC